MKAIIEQSISLATPRKAGQFVDIINTIANSRNEDSLRKNMKFLFQAEIFSFEYGFGSHHMWVNDLDSIGVKDNRVIFVEF